MIKKIKKLLIANRGEIALRIQAACKSLNIPTVSIASEADKDSLVVRRADQVEFIGANAVKDSYLSIDKIIAAAKSSGCNALHPGYGFLSENVEFAQRVNKEEMIFIGPQPEAIRILGNKTLARQAVEKFNVPCTPGSLGGLSDELLIKEAQRIGFPVIIKAVAGGGGRGMRVVRTKDQIKDLLVLARSEALKNFASDEVYIEKYLENPRHVEVQIFGDTHGNIIHFGTRDCSVQRRHQKLIEEAPAPAIDKKTLDKIHAAALRAAKSVNYQNAGTVEFLFDGEKFFFLEINTRIQVEHPVTEVITGEDLVAWQLKVAMGENLPPQSKIKFSGTAIEFRIYAEDVKNNFMPAVGKIEALECPKEEYIRHDYGFEAGDQITPYYDAMIAKLIVSGPSRAEAIRNGEKALRGYKLEGLPNTVPFHRWVLGTEQFKQVRHNIGFVDSEFRDVEKLLDRIDAGDIIDPLHRAGVAGSEVVETYQYRSEKFDHTYNIEVLHRSDGMFVAMPLGKDGKRVANRYCRSSNGFNTVMAVLVQEVLEQGVLLS